MEKITANQVLKTINRVQGKEIFKDKDEEIIQLRSNLNKKITESKRTTTPPLDPNENLKDIIGDDILKVFTDGACNNNGRENAKAGFGVYFGPNDGRNVSEPVPSPLPQTNNVGELLAIEAAIDQL